MNYVQVLTRYKAWADDLFLAVVSDVPVLQLTAPRPIVFGSLIRTLNHSYAMDYVWQSHLLGKPHGLTTRNPEKHPEMQELATAQREMDNWYVNYADSISGSELGEIVEFEFIGGGRGAMSRRDILLHVVNHTTYHRGHAADILYHLNIFPPTTDLPVFLREQPPATKRFIPAEAALRYSRPYTLCIEALHELATQPGDARIRVKAIDPEFYSLSESDFPERRGARQRFMELCAFLGVAGTVLNASDVAARLAALTVEDAGAIAQKIWELHREFSHYMDDDEA